MPPPGGRCTVLAHPGDVLLRKNTYVGDGRGPMRRLVWHKRLRQMGDRRTYIIEDERLLRNLVRQSLADCCTHVEEFESAESFLTGHNDRAAGCIIVDINLPGINGL